jgi:transposase
MARVVITAVVLEGRSRSAVARDYGVSRRWVQVLVARYLAGGETASGPRSRRPHASPQRTSQATEDAIVALRKELAQAGLDAGAETIAWHLRHRAGAAPSVATIWRVLARRGFVTPQPHKRPRSSWHRFAADLPNELWQAGITHWPLAGGSDAEIPSITGRQVWNRQRKDEVLLDVNDVAQGHVTKLRWNSQEEWVWSDGTVHTPIVPADQFMLAQRILAGRGGRPTSQTRKRTPHTYQLRGLLFCAACSSSARPAAAACKATGSTAPLTTAAGSRRSTRWPTR